MDILKKHILSILCGVVALVALVLSFWPLGFFQKEAQGQLEKRAALYGQLKTLQNTKHYYPILNMDTAEPVMLEGFPNRTAITKAKELQEELAREKSSVLAAAEQANKQDHEVLVPGALPEPKGSTELFFRDVYLRTIAGLPQRMNAGHPPTETEVKTVSDTLWKNEYEPKILMKNNQPDPESRTSVENAFKLDTLGLAEREKRKRASEISLYLASDGLQAMPDITPTATSSSLTAKRLWYAQLSLWVQQDVIRSVSAINAGKNVLEAPVKQWVKFEMDAMPYRLAPGAAAGSTPAGPVFNESWTGRVCNPLYDVVKFKFTADVATDEIPRFLQELGRGRFITPLNVDISAIDTNILAASPNNMIYGNDPVARVVVRCEALFLRSWTLPLMPTEVKQKDLGIGQPTGG